MSFEVSDISESPMTDVLSSLVVPRIKSPRLAVPESQTEVDKNSEKIPLWGTLHGLEWIQVWGQLTTATYFQKHSLRNTERT